MRKARIIKNFKAILGFEGGGILQLSREEKICAIFFFKDLKSILGFKGVGAAILQLSREEKICTIFFLQEFLNGVCRSKFNRTSTNRWCYLNST